jgi:hypothetical protein
MTKRKDFPNLIRDLEKHCEPVADSFIDEGLGVELLTVRLRGLWSDLIPVSEESRDSDAVRPSRAAVPLLDEMKGIREWD